MPATTTWPDAADPAAAERLRERFAATGEAAARLAARPDVAALLRALGGNSPYLADLAVREADTVAALVEHGPDRVVADVLAALAALSPGTPPARLRGLLRQAKRRLALAVAVADLGFGWCLDPVVTALSDLADAALQLAVAALLRAAHDAGALVLPAPDDPGTGSGFAVLGMGKLGARELNYSSDVDLVLLYDPAGGAYSPGFEAEAMAGFWARLARDLVGLMEARDADGYVFRTDLRLRPDPAATPPAIALPAAIAYYESLGQNWERAAMLKARPVAGDLALGHAFLREIRPFVWRRHLDFAAIADIHAMKRRIDSQVGGAPAGQADPVARALGHNLKLGEGGIREIEFLVQTLQLVWGGRDPALREPATLRALRVLAGAGRLPERAAAELADAYRFLRRTEHRLQMVADRQTHTLPERPAELDRFAVFMNYPDAAAFAGVLAGHLDAVREHYAALFVQLPLAAEKLDFSGPGEAHPATVARIAGFGFRDVGRIVATVRGWLAGRARALRSDRSRELLGEMLPALLAALAGQPDPDAAFGRFDALLSQLPAGVQLLSLFQRNPALLDRVAAVLGAAPMLADHLARHPAALDGLLTPEHAREPGRLLAARLADARLLEDAIAIVRRTVREEDFGIAVATLEGRIDADRAGLDRTALADAAVAALLPRVLDDFAARNGTVPGGALAVVAMGKAGGREMMAGSDLDLILVYDHPPEHSESSGGSRRLAASQWFVRACHAFIAALTAPGADGPLYAVDMRLRPSGNKGPLAVSLDSFRRYHAESAWTWERLALTRARVVAGPQPLREAIEAAIATAIAAAGEPERIRADTVAMRVRIARELPPDGGWDTKLRAGGQIEVEFIAQALQLAAARSRPELCSPTIRVALQRLRGAGLLAPADAALLIRADRVWRTVQGMLRITLGRHPPPRLPDATARPLLRAAAAAGAPAIDLDTLGATLEVLAAAVRGVFVRLLGPIGSEQT